MFTRREVIAAILLLVLFTAAQGLAQAPVRAGVASDVIARSKFRSASQALGWTKSPNAPVLDLLATGTLTHYHPDGSTSSPVPVVIKFRGSQHYRIDVSEPAGTRSTIVNGLGGASISSDGKTRILSASAAISVQAPIFPFILDELNPDNPQTLIEDIGVLAGTQSGAAQRLHVRTQDSPGFVGGLRSRSSEKTLWLSASGAPERIDFFRLAGDNHYARVPFTLLLADYRQVSGVAVPFEQTEQLDGQTIQVLTLQSVSLGPSAGIADSDFAVPSGAISGGLK